MFQLFFLYEEINISMKIVEKLTNHDLELFVSGRIDTVTAPELEAKIKEKFPSCLEISLDLSAVEYISSAGLRVVLAAYKAAGKTKRFIIKNPSPFCMQVFEATGMAPLLNIVNS